MRIGSFLLIPAIAAGAQNLPFNQPGTTKLFLASKNGGAVSSGTSGVVLQNSAATLEWVFSGGQLSAFAPGAEFTALSFRNATTTGWPAGGSSFGDFSLSLGRGLNGPGSLSPVISENVANSTVVRSGPLTIGANAFLPRPNALTPAPFSFDVPFAGSYAHVGGNLHLLLSQTGGSAAGLNVDGAGSGDPDNNVLFQARSASGAGADETTQSASAPTTRLSVDPQISLPLVAATTSNGTNPFTNALGSAPATVLFVIAADQLRFIPRGSLITSLSFRLSPNQAAWPGAETSTDSFQIQLSSAVTAPGAMSTNFPSNIAINPLIVRDGALALEPGFFPATEGSARAFGSPIHFQRGFVYPGGNLCVVVRHTAFTLPGPSLDTANPPSAVRAIFVQDASSANGSFLPGDAAPAIRIGYTPSACVIPSRATVSGGSGAFLFDTPRVHQMLIDETELSSIPRGSTINGFSLRVSPVGGVGYVSWPSVDSTVTQFDVDMSISSRLAVDMSDFFVNNEGAPKIRVRSGPLFIPARSFKVVGTSVAEHTFFIPFSAPFVYQGGTICMTMRLGQTVGGPTVNMDGQFRPIGNNARRSTSSSTATSGNTALSFAARFAFTPPPATCPADLNADGQVDDTDFGLFVPAYDTLETPAADFNFDGVTDDADFAIFVQAYDAFVCL